MAQSTMGSVHMVTALAAILFGLAVVILPKGRAAHRLAGLFYVFAMLATNLSALLIYRLTGRFNLFHAFALLSLVCILIGLALPLIRPANWLVRHAYWMAWSYLGLLAAALNEAAIRLPLHVDTPPRIIGVGVVIAICTGFAGRALRPRWERAVLRFGS
jgi:uncharacterized membrane protein